MSDVYGEVAAYSISALKGTPRECLWIHKPFMDGHCFIAARDGREDQKTPFYGFPCGAEALYRGIKASNRPEISPAILPPRAMVSSLPVIFAI